MSTSHARARVLATPLLLGLIGLVASSCAPPQAAPYGISFYPPAVGYVNKHFTPTATATSGLPVSFALAASSTGCSLAGGAVSFDAVGSCVINADQAGDTTYPAAAQVQRTIAIHECPVLRPGIWTGPSGLSATVIVSGSTFTGYVDLSSLGFGVQVFAGIVSCEVVSMTFNSTPLTGELSYDGTTLSSSYSGISIVLHAPV